MWKRITQLLAGLLILILPALAWAQIAQPERIEIEIDRNSNDFFVVSAKDQGLIIFRDTEEKNKEGNNLWEFHKYDTSLQKEWNQLFALDPHLMIRGYDYDQGQLCVLFQDGTYRDKDMMMLNMAIHSGDTVQHSIKRIVPVDLDYFEIIGQTVILGGQVNYRPAVVHYDMLTRKIKVLPGIYQNNGELIDIIPNKKDNTFDVLIGELTADRIKTVTIKAYDQYSNLLQTAPVITEDKKNLLDAQVTEFDGEQQILAGTYGPKRSKYSRGLFIASITPEGQQQIKYYNYADLNNFFNYMSEKREKRVRKRIERRKRKNRKIRLNYRMVVHELKSDNGKYILLGEAYYPKYNSYYYSGLYSGYFPSRFNESYFDGYRYTHAIAVCFNDKGDLLWDHAFKLDNAKSMELKQLVHINVQDEGVVLMYSCDKEIHSKVISDKGAIEETVTTSIKLKYDEDEVKRKNGQDVAGIQKWYDQYFYVHGTQDIKNKEENGISPTRKVFFINKVTYDAML